MSMPRFAYQRPDDLHVFGLTADEGKRIANFERNNPELACGDKTFEVRLNDRDFNVGDLLVLQEWDQVYTREAVTKIVIYILHGGRFGIHEGYVVMGLKDYVGGDENRE